MRFVLSTGNPDKAVEIGAILSGFDLVPRPADLLDVEEDGATLEENALIKARTLVEATGEAAIADDTGLEVDALDGRPGVHSSRFAGEKATYAANVKKLLEELDGVPPARRGARFRTVAVAVFPDGREIITEGVLEGSITALARGMRGFGYDPVFVPAENPDRTLAEMPPEDKNGISHRGRAFRALAGKLREAGVA